MNAPVTDFLFGHPPAKLPAIATAPKDAHWRVVRTRRDRRVNARLATKDGVVVTRRGRLRVRAGAHYILRRRGGPSVLSRAAFERLYQPHHAGGYVLKSGIEHRYFKLPYACVVQTPEGPQRAAAGDWIVESSDGLRPLTPAAGRRTFVPVRLQPLESPPQPHTFAHLVEAVAAMADNHDVGGEREITVGDVLNAAGRRTYGPLLLLIGLFSISPATVMPGMTWFSAALTLLLSLQLAMGAKRPWLPPGLLRVRVSRESIRAGAEHMRAGARRIDSVLKPRLVFLSEPPFANLAGLACAIAALATFPLGLIPVAPLAPGLAIVFIGLGLFIRDGLLLLAGGVVMTGALWLAYASFT